jgi:hypothetical protein
MSGYPTNYGADLKREWRIPAEQVRFHKGGRFYMPPRRFPAALSDPRGYLLLPSPAAIAAEARLQLGRRLNASVPISRLPGYVRMA